MIRLSLLISILLIGLSMAIAENGRQSHKIHQKRFSSNNEQIRSLRNLMGKLIDTDTHTLYAVNGQRQQDVSLNSDATTSTTLATPIVSPLSAHLKETACIAACNFCVEEYPLENRKKKAADNCGPMCDCADSCLVNPAEEVGQTYGQNVHVPNGQSCWWNTFTEILNNGLSSLP